MNLHTYTKLWPHVQRLNKEVMPQLLVHKKTLTLWSLFLWSWNNFVGVQDCWTSAIALRFIEDISSWSLSAKTCCWMWKEISRKAVTLPLAAVLCVCECNTLLTLPVLVNIATWRFEFLCNRRKRCSILVSPTPRWRLTERTIQCFSSFFFVQKHAVNSEQTQKSVK